MYYSAPLRTPPLEYLKPQNGVRKEEHSLLLPPEGYLSSPAAGGVNTFSPKAKKDSKLFSPFPPGKRRTLIAPLPISSSLLAEILGASFFLSCTVIFLKGLFPPNFASYLAFSGKRRSSFYYKKAPPPVCLSHFQSFAGLLSTTPLSAPTEQHFAPSPRNGRRGEDPEGRVFQKLRLSPLRCMCQSLLRLRLGNF